MLIVRTRPNDCEFSGVCFHPGANFVDDETFSKIIENNSEFKANINSGFMCVVKPENFEGKQIKGKKDLTETVVSMREDQAILIIKTIIDGVVLKEISKLDKRRNVVSAAELQIENRQSVMNKMSPNIPQVYSPIPIGNGDFE